MSLLPKHSTPHSPLKSTVLAYPVYIVVHSTLHSPALCMCMDTSVLPHRLPSLSRSFTRSAFLPISISYPQRIRLHLRFLSINSKLIMTSLVYPHFTPAVVHAARILAPPTTPIPQLLPPSTTKASSQALAAFLQENVHDEQTEPMSADVQIILSELIIRLSFFEDEDTLMDEEPYECLPPTPAVAHGTYTDTSSSAEHPSFISPPDRSQESVFIREASPSDFMDVDSPRRLNAERHTYKDSAMLPATPQPPQPRYLPLAEQISPLTYSVFGAGSPCTPITSRSPSQSPTLSRPTMNLLLFKPMTFSTLAQRCVVARAGGSGRGGGGGTGAVFVDWDPTCRRNARGFVPEVVEQLNVYPDRTGIIDQQQDQYASSIQQRSGPNLTASRIHGASEAGVVDNDASEDEEINIGNQGRQVWDRTVQLPSSNVILSAPLCIAPSFQQSHPG
ncbi:hypothetical protein BDN72DRAFT_906577 [Pluteus cervinus]|uniref:Uncharacterized protein n=1 Tax=Pluteus cervinus TaxID=181527 RepID=A0ACD2ZYG5_9AGAR|nr:hypothetical protein BDN72DRAFT_906577 [Pluteus cervinus]